jgi:hypothetical protein
MKFKLGWIKLTESLKIQLSIKFKDINILLN